MKGITTIAFNADDTLWVNEPYFQEVKEKKIEHALEHVRFYTSTNITEICSYLDL